MRSDEATDEPLKVLIVEDEPLLAMDLEAQLREMGHTVIGMASDAEAALRLAEGQRPCEPACKIDPVAGRIGVQN